MRLMSGNRATGTVEQQAKSLIWIELEDALASPLAERRARARRLVRAILGRVADWRSLTLDVVKLVADDSGPLVG
jgi:hypothetical protein